MSLTLSTTASSSPLLLDYPCRRSNTISTASDDTARHHVCRYESIESIRFSSSDRKENHRALQPGRYPKTYAELLINSEESLQTIPLGSRSPSLFEGFSSVAATEVNDIDTTTILQDPLFCQHVSEQNVSAQFDPTPFRRWLSKLRHPRHSEFSARSEYSPLLGEHVAGVQRESESSRGVVSRVRTATVTMADTSIAPRSWIGTRFNHLRRSANSSHDNTVAGPIMDEAAWSRAVQRRKILEELVESEESYVADLKVLTNVYFTLLASVSALSSQARVLVRGNLGEILQMHEALLGELYRVIPHSEYSQSHAAEPPIHIRGHVRWHSADSGIGLGKLKDSRFARRLRHSIDIARAPKQSPVGAIADPKTSAAVAKVFEQFLPQFFAYEEYGAKYELIVQDLATTQSTLNTSEAFERGIELLSRAVESMNNRDEHGRKGLTFADLVIKPIQRVCKYPLLFTDLARQTSVADDPEAHANVEKILLRLKEATREINRATDDPSLRALIEKTWLLQDRLRFPDETVPSVKESRLLGHVLLCGVLHVAYQDKMGIKGRYMVCALFKAFLLLAVPQKGCNTFKVIAIIPTMNIGVEDADNGRGLQCHTAQFTWKLVFQADYRLFELILSACSPVEEKEWKQQLNNRSCIENLDSTNESGAAQDSCSLLALDLKALGVLYGQPNTLARRMSIHRAATLGPKSHMNQVMIKNTESTELSLHQSSNSSLPISRSKSVGWPSHIQVLAPKRFERVNLEVALSDVWTKESLPYPGMKADSSLKVSAGHVIRKLSIASLASTFSRRSSTFDQLPRMPKLENLRPRCSTPSDLDLSSAGSSRFKPSKLATRQKTLHSLQPKAPPPVTIDFHKNPEMFLPPDFELKDPRVSKPPRKKLTIRTVSDDGIAIENLKKRPHFRLQRSVSERMPAVKEVAEKLRPRTPLSPRKSTAHKAKLNGFHVKTEASVQKASKPLSKQLRKLLA